MSLKKLNSTPVSTKDAIAELFMKLESEGCDPVTELARMAMDPLTPLEQRVSILKDLAGYTAPKRRAVDVVNHNEDGITVKIIKYSKADKLMAERLMNPVALAEERAKNQKPSDSEDSEPLLTQAAG
jgi:hypothetical protein